MTSPVVDWSPFASGNSIGDPGRQPEIKSVSGPLTVGVADTELDFLSLDSFEVRGCSTRGWSHRFRGTPRQDSFALLTNDDILVIAVADGVSEGDFSQVAAETAARSACKLASDQFARNGAIDWVQLARRVSLRIIDEAEYRQISAPEGEPPSIDERLRACLTKMSTTLIVAVIQRSARSDGFAGELGVVAGDSAAYVIRPDCDFLTPLGGGKSGSGPITSTGVRPLPGPVESTAIPFILQPGEALILGSDGLSDPVGDGAGDVGQEFARRWAEPPRIDQFVVDVNVYRRSYDDDRTAVGLWVRPDVVLPTAPIAPTSGGAGEGLVPKELLGSAPLVVRAVVNGEATGPTEPSPELGPAAVTDTPTGD